MVSKLLNSPYSCTSEQIQRRLAQNREAARKSRLRKKVNRSIFSYKSMIENIYHLANNQLNICCFYSPGLCSTIRNKPFEVGSVGART